MSGGHFNYNQDRISQIADSIGELIYTNNSQELNDYGDKIGLEYAPEVIKKFREGLDYLRIAEVYAQRIDWLVSGDDSEESFLIRLKNDLNDLPKVIK